MNYASEILNSFIATCKNIFKSFTEEKYVKFNSQNRSAPISGMLINI